MATINELYDWQEELLNELMWLEEGDDEREIIKRYLMLNKGKAEDKIKYLHGVLVEADAVSTARKEVAEKAIARAKAAENAKDRLKSFILDAMTKFDIKSVETEWGKMSQQLGPKKLVYGDGFNLDKLPDFCVKTEVKRTPIAREIMELIESGESVDDVVIIRQPHLRLR